MDLLTRRTLRDGNGSQYDAIEIWENPADKRTGRSTLAGSALSDPDDRAADKLLGRAIIDTGGER